MYKYYYVNKDTTGNPKYNHEVHTEECAIKLKISNKEYLGSYDNCNDAVRKAKDLGYSNVDGCIHCCYACHNE